MRIEKETSPDYSITKVTFLIDVDTFTQLKTEEIIDSPLVINQYFKSLLIRYTDDEKTKSVPIQLFVLLDVFDLMQRIVTKTIFLPEKYVVKTPLEQFYDQCIVPVFDKTILKENFIGCPSKDGNLLISHELIEKLKKDSDPRAIFMLSKKGSSLERQASDLGYQIIHSHRMGEVDERDFDRLRNKLTKERNYENTVLATDFDDTVVLHPESQVAGKYILNKYLLDIFGILAQQLKSQDTSYLVITARNDPSLSLNNLIAFHNGRILKHEDEIKTRLQLLDKKINSTCRKSAKLTAQLNKIDKMDSKNVDALKKKVQELNLKVRKRKNKFNALKKDDCAQRPWLNRHCLNHHYLD